MRTPEGPSRDRAVPIPAERKTTVPARLRMLPLRDVEVVRLSGIRQDVGSPHYLAVVSTGSQRVGAIRLIPAGLFRFVGSLKDCLSIVAEWQRVLNAHRHQQFGGHLRSSVGQDCGGSAAAGLVVKMEICGEPPLRPARARVRTAASRVQ